MKPTGDDYRAAIDALRVVIEVQNRGGDKPYLKVLDEVERLATVARRERLASKKPPKPYYPNSACEARG